MVDRVKPLKLESPDTGGSQTDEFPTSMDPNEDYVDARGLALQDATSDDADVLVSRDASGNMSFLDKVIFAAHTLLDLARGALTASITSEPTGFPNRTDAVLSFSDSSPDRTFQIAPSGASFKYYIAGVEYIKTAADTIQIPDTEGLWVIYYDGTTLQATQSVPANIFSAYVIVAYVYWNATDKVHVRLGDEDHLFMPWPVHKWAHFAEGARYISGLDPTGMVVDGDGSLDSHAQIGTTAGVFYDEDIEHTPTAISSTANKEVLYKVGLNSYWRAKTPNAFPVVEHPSGRLAYNDWDPVTGWGQEQVPNNRYVLMHKAADNDKSRNHVFYIQGENWYQNLNAAREGALVERESITTDGLPAAELVWIGTFIFLTQTAMTNTPQAALVSAIDPITGESIDFVDHRKPSAISGSGQQAAANFPPGHLDGLGIAYAGGRLGIDYNAGTARSDDDGGNIVIPVDGQIDLTTTGIDALDTGTLAANTWYAVWAVSGTNGSGCIASTSFTAPTLPTGYDSYKRRIGAVKTDATPLLIRFYQIENGRDRITYWDYQRAQLTVLSNGNATSWTSVDCSAWMPSGCLEGFIAGQFRSTTVGNSAEVRRDGASGGNPVLRPYAQVANAWCFISPWRQTVSTAQALEYICDSSDDDLTLRVFGYVDNV